MRDNKNTFSVGKQGEPSRAEGGSVLGNIAMSVGDLAIEKGIPFLAKKGLEAGRYYSSEVFRDPNLQKKAIKYTLDKARPVFQKVGSEMLDQISTKARPNRRHTTDRPDLDGAGINIHAAIGKLSKPKRGHNYTGPYNPLEQQVKYDPETGRFSKYINNQRGQQTRSQCNMTWSMVSVRTETKNTVKMKINANTKRTKKWWRLSTQFRGNKGSGVMRQRGTQLI